MQTRLNPGPVSGPNRGRASFIYIVIVALTSTALIAFNEFLRLGIPFTVHFLVGIVGALLVFVVWHAIITKGWMRSLALFAGSFLLAFTAEALGVNFGLIFGRYYYTSFLGPGLFGVPFLAALAWEPILYAAFSLTEMLLPDRSGVFRPSTVIGAAMVGALATTAWDMMIDPIAVHQGWWVWSEGGPYVKDIGNGVPISNFMGWLGVSFIIMLLYQLGTTRTAKSGYSLDLIVRGPMTLYATLFLTASGVTLSILGRPEVALVGLMAMGPFLALAWTHGRHAQKAIESST